MPLWLLRPVDPDGTEPFVWQDTAQGFVVRAGTERQARGVVVASDWRIGPGQEGTEVWMNPARVSCVRIDLYGKPGVILRDFHHSQSEVNR